MYKNIFPLADTILSTNSHYLDVQTLYCMRIKIFHFFFSANVPRNTNSNLSENDK